MKVLIANKFFYLKGGSERVLFQERQFLLNKGIQVIDFSMQDPNNLPSLHAGSFVTHIDYQDNPGILNKVKQGIKFIHSFEAIHNLDQLVLKERPDIAHLHNIYHQMTPAIIPLLKRHGIPVVLTLHDSKLICPSYLMLNQGRICQECSGKYFWKPLVMHCQNSRIQELLLMLEAYWHRWRGSYSEVDLFLAPSRYMAELVSLRVPREKVRVLNNGIDIDSFIPSYSDHGYALYIGRLSREKGVETLLQAHEIMKCNLPLKIVGSGPLEAELRRKYPHAVFMGYQQGDELYALVRNASCVVVPSECHENCPMVVLEAMALGKPVIGSRAGGIPEQVEDSRTGLLFEMGNAQELAEKMHILAENPELRLSLGQAARKKCEEEYSLATHCRDLMCIYEQL